jgi:alanyl-tRNA synthetase
MADKQEHYLSLFNTAKTKAEIKKKLVSLDKYLSDLIRKNDPNFNEKIVNMLIKVTTQAYKEVVYSNGNISDILAINSVTFYKTLGTILSNYNLYIASEPMQADALMPLFDNYQKCYTSLGESIEKKTKVHPDKIKLD